MNNNYENSILIIEDEPTLSGLLQDYFKASNFNTHVIDRGDQVIDWLSNNKVDAIILDLMLPGLDGLEVCKQVRQRWDTPILMTTAKVEEIDRLLGLELGADDYICKPYSPREVVARVKTVLRRVKTNATDQTSDSKISLQVDRCQVIIHGRTIDLTATETALLDLLMSEPGRIFSRSLIMDRIYKDYRIVSERTIDSHIKKLRKKVAPEPGQQEFIQSVYGVGYKYEPE
jgi:two-component system response regulator BaeR